MWLAVEDFSFFKLNNTKIWAVLDCSFRTEDGGVAIIDWKTGRSMSEDVSMQLSWQDCLTILQGLFKHI
jgi:hypothetical protein